MTATPKKPQTKPGSPTKGGPAQAGPPVLAAPAAAARATADGEKTFFRLRSAADTLGTPSDTSGPGAPGGDAAGGAAPEGGFISRWLRGAPATPRQPRRRTPPPAEAPLPMPEMTETVTGTILEPEQDAPDPDAVESYRSASDLTAPEDPPKSKFVA